MTTGELQDQIFKAIGNKTGTATSANEIATLLNISTDSAYRRMRGEKTVTLEELHLLCSHYQVFVCSIFVAIKRKTPYCQAEHGAILPHTKT